MNSNPHQVTKDFEQAVAEYTGAPYAVAVNSCTMALFLCCKWHFEYYPPKETIYIPKKTYISVPQAIIHAGGKVKFSDVDWVGFYRLAPYFIFDSARSFTSEMYMTKSFMCLSFHASKTLGIEQGGMILHDDPKADEWFRMARHDGRIEGRPISEAKIIGWHCYMNPSTAAQGLLKMYSIPKHNPDLPNDDYPDLSQLEMFK